VTPWRLMVLITLTWLWIPFTCGRTCAAGLLGARV
jgi:hypothetical protein